MGREKGRRKLPNGIGEGPLSNPSIASDPTRKYPLFVIASFAAAANGSRAPPLCNGGSRREIPSRKVKRGVGSEPTSSAIEAEPTEQKYHHDDDQ